MTRSSEFDFKEWEEHVYHNCRMYKDGRYFIRYGSHSMEYSLGRFDFDYEKEIKTHVLYKTTVGNEEPTHYNAWNIGVGLGYESVMPLSYLRNFIGDVPISFTATNVNTPPRYEPPQDKLLFSEKGHIKYNYWDQFLLEEAMDIEHQADLLLASRVVEWSQKPDTWFRQAYSLLKPGGIAIIHTPRAIGTAPYYQNVDELALQAGFTQGTIKTSQTLDPHRPIERMFLYKPLDTPIEFPDWIAMKGKANLHHFADLPTLEQVKQQELPREGILVTEDRLRGNSSVILR